MLNFLKRLQEPSGNLLLGGRYQVIQQLGQGGFGQTFLAQDNHLPGNPICVIKQFHPQTNDPDCLQTARRLFDTEAQVLYKLGEHSQIPRLMAHFEDNQEFYLAQEYVEGETLDKLLNDEQPWKQGWVIALLMDILQSLAFVHRRNVIHRDIKPSNLICRRRDGRIVLIDFGAVKQVNTQFFNPRTGKTNLTVSIGTHGYVPGEQLGGTPHFSSDVYAVGIIGVQLLTGVKPKHFRHNPRTSELEWREMSVQVHPALAAVIDCMVRYDYRERFPTAAEALAALQELPSELLSTVPERWYIPSDDSFLPFPPQEATAALNQNPAPVQAAANFSPAGSRQSNNSSRPLTPAAFSRFLSGRLFSGRKSQSATVPVAVGSSVYPTIPQRNWLMYGVLLGGGLLCTLIVRNYIWPTVFSPSVNVASSPAAPSTPSSSETEPTSSEVSELLNQAENLRQQGQFKEALDIYDQAIEQGANSVDAYWGRCYNLNKLHRIQAAISACDQAIALDENDPRPISSKGFALQQQERHKESLQLFDQAIEIQPDNAEFWNNRGTALLRLKRAKDALEAFDKAIELQPDLAEVWNNRGAALWSLRQFDEAVESVAKAIELRPNYPDALSLQEQMKERLNR